MVESQEKNEQNSKRAALYVDGFNLYHPIHDTGLNYLKWLNLWLLGERMCQKLKLKLVKVVFCTAVPDKPADIRDRHNSYNNALKVAGVTVLNGHHMYDPITNKRTEKQSDINLALSLMVDAHDDLYDYAYLLTADSDQAATGRFFKERFKEKKLISVAPPDKKPPKRLLPFCDHHFALVIDDIEACLFPNLVQGKKGFIRRPAPYDPPIGWVSPENRPKKK